MSTATASVFRQQNHSQAPPEGDRRSMRDLVVRSSSQQELINLLRNPYELTTDDSLNLLKAAQKPTQKGSNHKAKSAQMTASKQTAKSVPFGTGTRRPIGESTLHDITQYTYIPDMRYLNALTTAHMKEERRQQILSQKATVQQHRSSNYHQQRVQASVSSKQLALTQTAGAKSQAKMHQKSKKSLQMVGHEDYTKNQKGSNRSQYYGGEAQSNGSLVRGGGLQTILTAKLGTGQTTNRSLSTVAQQYARLEEKQNQLQTRLRMKQADSEAILDKNRSTIGQSSRDQNSDIGYLTTKPLSLAQSNIVNEKILRNQGGQNAEANAEGTLNTTTPVNENITINVGQLDHLAPDQIMPDLSQIKVPNTFNTIGADIRASHESNDELLHQTGDVITHQGPRYIHEQVYANMQATRKGDDDASKLYRRFSSDDNIQVTLNDQISLNQANDVTLQKDPSRILLKESSVQQMSHATLQPDSGRYVNNKSSQSNQEQSYRRKMNKNNESKSSLIQKNFNRQRRKTKREHHNNLGSNSKSLHKDSSIQTISSVAVQSTFDGLMQSRKLAPSESAQHQFIEMAKERQSIQIQRQNVMADNKAVLDRLAGEFLDQLNSDQMLQVTPLNKVQSGAQRNTFSLPAIPSALREISVAENSSIQALQTPQLLKKELSYSSKLLFNKRKLKQQYETTQQQKKQLLSVISAQKLHNPDELSPWEAYVSGTHKVDSKLQNQTTAKSNSVTMQRSIPIKTVSAPGSVLVEESAHMADFDLNNKSSTAFSSRMQNNPSSTTLPQPTDKRIPRSTLQQEVSNERTYQKVSLKQKREEAKRAMTISQMREDSSQQLQSQSAGGFANTTEATVVENQLDSQQSYTDIIPRLSQWPMQGKTIKVAGHDDSKIFSTQSSRALLSKTVDSVYNENKASAVANAANQANNGASDTSAFGNHSLTNKQARQAKLASQWKSLHKSGSRKSIETLLATDPTKKQLANIVDQKGVRKHYLDDEIRGKSYMKDVGPASYETYDKIVAVSTQLMPNIAPAIIYRDYAAHAQPMLEQEKKASEAFEQLNGDLSSLKTIVHTRSLSKEINNITPKVNKTQNTTQQPLIETEKIIVESNEFNVANQTVSRNNQQQTTLISSQGNVNQSLRDSLEFNVQAAYSQIVLPKITATASHQKESIPNSPDTQLPSSKLEHQPQPLRDSQARKTSALANQTSYTTALAKITVPIKTNSRINNLSQSRSHQGMTQDEDTTKNNAGANKSQRVQVASSVARAHGSQARQKTLDEGSLRSTTNARSNLDIDAVMKEDSFNASKLLQSSTKAVVQAHANYQTQTNGLREQDDQNFSVKNSIQTLAGAIPNELFERQEMADRAAPKGSQNSRKSLKSMKTNIAKNNHKLVGGKSQSRHYAAPSDGISAKLEPQFNSRKNSFEQTEKITAPEMVSYQISGPIYGGEENSNLPSSRINNSSKDATPVRVLNPAVMDISFTNDAEVQQTVEMVSARRHVIKPAIIPGRKAVGQASQVNTLKQSKEVGSALTPQKLELRIKNLHLDKSPLSGKPMTTEFRATLDSQETIQQYSHEHVQQPGMSYVITTENAVNQTEPEQPLLDVDPNSLSDTSIKLVMKVNDQEMNIQGSRQAPSMAQMVNQVKALKAEREAKNSKKKVINGGVVVSREPRFKYNTQAAASLTPGPGHYDSVYVKDIKVMGKSSSKKQIGLKVYKQSLDNSSSTGFLDQRSLSRESIEPADKQIEIPEEPEIFSDQKLVPQSPTQQKRKPSVSPLRQKGQNYGIKPSANFVSKAPRVQGGNKDFTGSVDFNDATTHTISKAQNELTLKTVQKMFAGRKEQHTVNVHKLVRINRLNQLQKLDPLINTEMPVRQSIGTDLPPTANNPEEPSGPRMVYLAGQPGASAGSLQTVMRTQSGESIPQGEMTTDTAMKDSKTSDYGFIFVDTADGAVRNQGSSANTIPLLQLSRDQVFTQGILPKGEELSLLQAQLQLSSQQSIDSQAITYEDEVDLQGDYKYNTDVNNMVTLNLQNRRSDASIETLNMLYGQQVSLPDSARQVYEGSEEEGTETGHRESVGSKQNSSQPLMSGIQSGRYSIEGVTDSKEREEDLDSLNGQIMQGERQLEQ